MCYISAHGSFFVGLPGRQFIPLLSLERSGKADITGSMQYVTSFKNTPIFRDLSRAVKFHKKTLSFGNCQCLTEKYCMCVCACILTRIDPVKFHER